MKLPEKLTSLKAYDPITGSYAVRLDANESYFDLPSVLKSKIADQIEQISFNRYPDPLATEVVEAFAAYYHVLPDCVTAGNGSDERRSRSSRSSMCRKRAICKSTPMH